jgi:hypothetical protein
VLFLACSHQSQQFPILSMPDLSRFLCRSARPVVFRLGSSYDRDRKVSKEKREISWRGVRPGPAAHNAVGLAGESPVVEIDCLST